MDTALSPPAGQLLGGRYHVGSRLARGGMATVYLGTDTRLDRVVAIKIAHPELSDDAEFVRRFIGEAKSAARLSSPNVVAVYDQGSVGRLHYIAMEYVPGRTLRQLLNERGRLGPRDTLDIMAGVLSGLAAAHQAGIAHRDVKPENVLLTNAGAVKVADFGLARSVAGAVQTKGGIIIGTAAYLAPEQVSGGTSDARTDVYAAGIMLYELLTGTHPHMAESPLAVAYKHVNEVVPPPSRILPGLPPALDALVALATSRDPELRPADAGQYLRAVSDVRDGRGLALGAPERGHGGYHERPGLVPTQLPPAPGQYHGGSGPLPGHVDPYREWAAFEQAPGAVGASALPSLGPQSAQVAPLPSAPLDGQLAASNRTLVVRDDGTSAPYGLAYGGYGPPGYAPPGYGHRARGRRASGPRREPWWRQWLFGRRFAYLAGGLAVALIIAVVSWWLSAGQYTSVPALYGIQASTARSELHQLGLRVGFGDPKHSSLPKGEVLSTSPGKGARVTHGALVTLIVSLGPVLVTCPNVSGQPVSQAKTALEQLKLRPGALVQAASSSVPSGNVIGTQPPAYARCHQGETVRLVVSAGPPLPNFVGQQLPAAQAAAQQGGYTINPVMLAHSTQPANTITRQSPAPNTPVSQGEVVTVYVSQGPPGVPVPNVQGMSVKQAVHTLTHAGFQVNIQQQGPGNTVGKYSPTGVQPQGSTITIYVGWFSGL